MFIQFFSFGAIVPIMSLYLKNYLNFSGVQTGIILAASSITAIISPLISAFIADRIIRAERLLVICHLVGAGLIISLYFQKTFNNVLILYLIYCMMTGPTIALITAVTFHHSKPNCQYRFGNIRLWGTIGWIAVAWFFSWFWLNCANPDESVSRLPHALILSSVSSIITGLYALSLPKTPAMQSGPRRIIPSDSFAVMIKPDVMLLCFVGFFISVVNRFYYFGVAPFLSQLGFKDSTIMPTMTIGQITEVFIMLLLGVSLLKLGFKKTFILGLLAEIIRFSMLAASSKYTSLVYVGIACHGPAFALFFTSISVYIDSKSDTQSRSGVHQMFGIVNFGMGALFGNIFAGKIMDLCADNLTSQINYSTFWLIPTAISILALILIIILFRNKTHLEPKPNLEDL